MTNVNKFLTRSVLAGALSLAALLVLAEPVGAMSAAPALDGVKEIIVQPVQFTNPKAADACGLSRDDMTTAVMQELQSDHMPVSLASEAKPQMIGVARIDLTMQVFTLNTQDLDCASWVEATASSNNNVAIPPIDTLRSVTIQYWHQGTMVASNQSVHERTVNETLQKMLHQFEKQYEIDQPPTLR